MNPVAMHLSTDGNLRLAKDKDASLCGGGGDNDGGGGGGGSNDGDADYGQSQPTMVGGTKEDESIARITPPPTPTSAIRIPPSSNSHQISRCSEPAKDDTGGSIRSGPHLREVHESVSEAAYSSSSSSVIQSEKIRPVVVESHGESDQDEDDQVDDDDDDDDEEDGDGEEGGVDGNKSVVEQRTQSEQQVATTETLATVINSQANNADLDSRSEIGATDGGTSSSHSSSSQSSLSSSFVNSAEVLTAPTPNDSQILDRQQSTYGTAPAHAGNVQLQESGEFVSESTWWETPPVESGTNKYPTVIHQAQLSLYNHNYNHHHHHHYHHQDSSAYHHLYQPHAPLAPNTCDENQTQHVGPVLDLAPLDVAYEFGGFVPVESVQVDKEAAAARAIANGGRRESSFMINDVFEQYNQTNGATATATKTIAQAHGQDVYLDQSYHQEDLALNQYPASSSDQQDHFVDTTFRYAHTTYLASQQTFASSTGNHLYHHHQHQPQHHIHDHQLHKLSNEWNNNHATASGGQGQCFNQYYNTASHTHPDPSQLPAGSKTPLLRAQDQTDSYQMRSDSVNYLQPNTINHHPKPDPQTNEQAANGSCPARDSSDQQSTGAIGGGFENQQEQESHHYVAGHEQKESQESNSDDRSDIPETNSEDHAEANKYTQQHAPSRENCNTNVEYNYHGVSKYDTGGQTIEYRPAQWPNSTSSYQQAPNRDQYAKLDDATYSVIANGYNSNVYGPGQTNFAADYYHDPAYRSQQYIEASNFGYLRSDQDDANKTYLLLGQGNTPALHVIQSPEGYENIYHPEPPTSQKTEPMMIDAQAQDNYEFDQQSSIYYDHQQSSDQSDPTTLPKTLPVVSKLYDPTAEISSALMNSNVDDLGEQSSSTFSSVASTNDCQASKSPLANRRCAQTTIEKLRAFLEKRQRLAQESFDKGETSRSSKAGCNNNSKSDKRQSASNANGPNYLGHRGYQSLKEATTAEKNSDNAPTRANSLGSASSSSSSSSINGSFDEAPVASSSTSAFTDPGRCSNRSSPSNLNENRQLRSRTVVITCHSSTESLDLHESSGLRMSCHQPSTTYGIQTRSSKRRRYNEPTRVA